MDLDGHSDRTLPVPDPLLDESQDVGVVVLTHGTSGGMWRASQSSTTKKISTASAAAHS